jgi:4-alpha-glucanotransferase
MASHIVEFFKPCIFFRFHGEIFVPNYDELADQLSTLCGIVPEYWDIFGNRHVASIETKKAILGAMNIDTGSAETLAAALLEKQHKPWRSFIDPVKVMSVNAQPFTISVCIPVSEGEEHRLTLTFSVENENGRLEEMTYRVDNAIIKDRQWIDGIRYVKADITDRGGRDVGYYKAKVACGHPEGIFPGGKNVIQKICRIIITPDKCYMPAELESGKIWGIGVNLYSVRSSRNWGSGDFMDLKNVIQLASKLKAGFVGINPLHATPNTAPYGISPYSPISRFYKNFIYLDMDAVPEVNLCESAREMKNSEVFKKELTGLTNGDMVEYEEVASLKKKMLRHAFDYFRQTEYQKNTPRDYAFRNYIEKEGDDLDAFALFLTIWEHMHNTGKTPRWQDWPKEFHSPLSDAVLQFRTSNENELLFYKYTQWLIDTQHAETAELVLNLGMPVGIYHDLAIGSTGGGCDAWKYQDITATDIDVGAPPDDFTPKGQNWAFPPLIPGKLKETGYDFFIKVMGKNMKNNGALRIDHALGLFRLFWIPGGASAERGAYVTYPEEDLLRIIALESVRNKTMVIAEDLGTVGDNVREALKKFGMLSYRLLYFERNYPDPSFAPPGHYPALALCSTTTHDLPTVYGYWSGRDIQVKNELHMYLDDETMYRHFHERERDKMLLLTALKTLRIIAEDVTVTQEMSTGLCLAVYEYLASTPCKLLSVSLDDVIGTLDQQNMPGIAESYPSWKQKTPLSLEQIVVDARFYALSDMFRKYNR